VTEELVTHAQMIGEPDSDAIGRTLQHNQEHEIQIQGIQLEG